MGLYDYLGGEQVKCFTRASVGIKPNDFDSDSFDLILSVVGGDLKGYSRGSAVPYKTPFYNYGKDFMVFDYRTFNYNESIIDDSDLMVHIIRNGRYFRSVPYNKVPSRYKIGLVIDNYGMVIDIKTKQDFIDIVYDWHKSHILYAELKEKYRNLKEIPDILRMSMQEIKEKNFTSDELNRLLEGNNMCMNMAHEESLGVFHNTWYASVKNIDDAINKGWRFGVLYSSLERQTISEFDKYWIARLFVKEIEDKEGDFNTALDNYFDWCSKNNIDEIDRDKLETFFSIYLKDIPRSIIQAYETSSDKALRDKIYGNIR